MKLNRTDKLLLSVGVVGSALAMAQTAFIIHNVKKINKRYNRR